jgi:hypothetical protein
VKDRFNLEDEINHLYTFCDNMNSLSEGILEQGLDKDDIVNALNGLKVLLAIQTSKLHDTMSQCFKLDNYNDRKVV